MDVMGRLVIFASEDGQSGWTPIRPEEVPEWLRTDGECLGRLVAGETAQGPGESRWYAARRVADTTLAPANDADGGDQVLAVRSPVVMKPHRPLVILPGEVDL